MLLQNLAVFIIAAASMIASSIILIKSLNKIARFLRISEFTAAFIIMAIATSSPELLVGISSAISNIPTLSLGNLLGASIIDLTLITGIFILIGKGITNKNHKMNYEVHYTLLAVVLVIILFVIGNSLSRIDGIILVSLFAFNFARMMKKRKKYSEKSKNRKIKKIEITILTFIIAFLILILSARFAVKSGSSLASDLNISKIMVGLFMISFATALPEFIFGIEACKLRHKGMAIGNITGGIFTNFSLILGLVAIISPIKVKFLSFIIPALFLLVSIIIFLRFLRTENKLKIEEGIGLILFYVLFLLVEFFIKP